MQFLELPLDVFKIVIELSVQELGLKHSMKARLTCRILADEILDPVIATRVIEDVTSLSVRCWRINYHRNVIARYLFHRVCTDGSITHAWITTVRETCRMLAQHTNSENDPARVELLERSACSCLAMNAGSLVFEVLTGKQKDYKTQLEGCTSVNCLDIATWIGDKTLVESLNKGSDLASFFGRPSWAAAAQGHTDLVQFFLDKAYELPGPIFGLSNSILAVAAYMNYEDITRLYVQSPYYCSEMPGEEAYSRDNTVVVKLIEEKQRELDSGVS